MSDSEPQTGAPAAASLGQTLRSARLEQDLTVEQIAAELRIEAKQLKALEDDRLSEIGVPVFIKGYLKQYGARLGLDVRDLLALYYRQTDLSDVQIQPSRTIKLRDERQITTWLLAGIVLLVLVVGLAVWWWNGGSFDVVRRSPVSGAATPTTATSEQRPATSSNAPVREPEAPPPVAPAEQIPAEAVVAAPAAAISEPAGVRDEGVEPPVSDLALPAVTIPLEFTFDAESWTEVSDARGERLLFGLSAAGRRVTVRGEPPFAILLGNANAVHLVVDGEEYPIPTRGREGELARFSVDIAEE
jgi:cytoskeleton protein RodZ